MLVRSEGLLGLFVVLAVQSVSCQTAPPPGTQLASDQTLRMPIPYDFSKENQLDPAQVTDELFTSIDLNIFDGLYRYDDQLRVVPDIADGMPAVSADGLTYTFHLKHGVRFSNGEPVTAEDFRYSWNRAAAAQGGNANAFDPVAGLSAPDAYTLVATLSVPAGYWLAELALPVASVVDKNVIKAQGEEVWWTTPEGLIGTGPFKLTSRTPGLNMMFSAVPAWWGDREPTLKHVELDVVPDIGDRWKGYAEGRFDLLGFGTSRLGTKDAAEVAGMRADRAHRGEIHTWSYGRTDWLGFNLQSGPFSGNEAGRALRLAFSQAIDRQKLAQAVCDDGTVCSPATGGLIPKGLDGYLGDGADRGSRFDPVSARATVRRLDPDGSLLRGIIYTFDAEPFHRAVADNLSAQWLANLGVEVTIRGLDSETFGPQRYNERLTLFRGSWAVDYNHPQDWFDPLPRLGTATSVSFQAKVTAADAQPLSLAIVTYMKAGQMVVDDSMLAALLYYVRTVVLKSYVVGYGANALWEYRWTSIRILQH
jgi:oligopeptide transport system substrate-binding protein